MERTDSCIVCSVGCFSGRDVNKLSQSIHYVQNARQRNMEWLTLSPAATGGRAEKRLHALALCLASLSWHNRPPLGAELPFTKTLAKYHQLRGRQDQLLLTKALIKYWDSFIRLGKHLWGKKNVPVTCAPTIWPEKQCSSEKIGLSQVQILPYVVRWPLSSQKGALQGCAVWVCCALEKSGGSEKQKEPRWKESSIE